MSFISICLSKSLTLLSELSIILFFSKQSFSKIWICLFKSIFSLFFCSNSDIIAIRSLSITLNFSISVSFCFNFSFNSVVFSPFNLAFSSLKLFNSLSIDFNLALKLSFSFLIPSFSIYRALFAPIVLSLLSWGCGLSFWIFWIFFTIFFFLVTSSFSWDVSTMLLALELSASFPDKLSKKLILFNCSSLQPFSIWKANKSFSVFILFSNKGLIILVCLNHWWFKISSKLGRSIGFNFNIFDIKFLARGGISFGHWIFNLRIFWYNSWFDFATKGEYPANNSNINIPILHISTLVSCPFFINISGAIYSGVPQKVFLTSPSVLKLDQP